MNWVDIVIIAVLVFFLVDGLGRLFIFEVFDLVGFALSLFISLRYYNLVASQLENIFSLPHSFANALGFIVAWYLLEMIFFIGVRSAFKRWKHKLRLPADEYLSIFPSMARGLIFIAILLVLVSTFPIKPSVKKAVNASFLGSVILSETYQLEAPLKGVFGGIVNDTLSFLTIKPRSDERVDLGFATRNFSFDTETEMAMISLVNKERVSRGLNALSFDPRLREVARTQSADMLSRGYFSHYSPEGKDVADRAESLQVEYLVIGENLAYAPSLSLAQNGLMNSPGHRANILSTEYNKVGIGAADAKEYGFMFTQVFSN